MKSKQIITVVLAMGLLATATIALFAGHPQLALELTEDSQHAKFLTARYVGGPGHPVWISTKRSTFYFKKKRIVVTYPESEMILERLSGGKRITRSSEDDPRIYVDAKIHLERGTATVSTNPPSKRDVYRVVIEELYAVRWFDDLMWVSEAAK